jgi:hypothetical protein
MVIQAVSVLLMAPPPLSDLVIEPGEQRLQQARVLGHLLVDLLRRDGDLDVLKACEKGLQNVLSARWQRLVRLCRRVVLPINPPAVTHKIAHYAHRQGPRIQACSQDTILPVVNHKFASSQL